MSEQNPGAPADAAATDTPAQTPPDGAPAQPSSSDEGWRAATRDAFKRINTLEKSIKDLVETFKGGQAVRDDKGKFQGKPADDDKVTARLAELDLREAIADSGIKLTPEQRGVVTRLFRAERPQDVTEWLKGVASTMALPGDKSAPVEPPAPPTSNTGAPAASGRAFAPHDPFALPPGAYSALPRKERDKLWAEFTTRAGMNPDPFAPFKKG